MAPMPAGANERACHDLSPYFDAPLPKGPEPSPLSGQTFVVAPHARGAPDDGFDDLTLDKAASLGSRWVCTYDSPRWDRWRFPRGIDWKDFPVALDPVTRSPSGNPRCTIHEVTGGIRRYVGHAPLADAMSDPRETVVAMPAAGFPGTYGHQRSRLLVAGCVDFLEAADRGGRIRLLDAGGFTDTDLAGLRAMCAPAEPLRRFRCTWDFNFRAIGSKALCHALSLAGPGDVSSYGSKADRSNLGRTPEYDLRHARHMADEGAILSPVTLQVLYDVARRGGTDVSSYIGPYGEPAASVLEAILVDGDGVLGWRGTGKYLAYPLHPMDVVTIWRQLEGLCLVEIVDGNLRIAPAGRHFLDALHPDCHDPDLPCRWTHRELGPDDQAAMDASLIRTFRKMKTRVNALGLR